MRKGFNETTKHQIAEIMFNLAMQISQDNIKKAVERINTERALIGKKPARNLEFWKYWEV